MSTKSKSSPRGTRSISRRDAIRALQDIKGEQCIYNESGFVRFVYVSDVKTDDWGTYLSISVISAPGFRDEPPNAFRATARWDALWISNQAVAAPEVSWLLLTDSKNVQDIVAAVARGQTDFALLSNIYASSPGPWYSVTQT